MKKPLLLLFIFSFLIGFSPKISAQDLIIDSLKTVLQKKELPSQERVMTLSRLAEIFSNQGLPKGNRMNRKAIQLAETHKDTNGLTFAWGQQVGIEFRLGNDSLAQQAVQKSLHYSQGASDVMRGYALYMKGYLQNLQNNPEIAIKFFQQALRHLNSAKGDLYRAGIYYLTFGIYAEQSDSAKAIKYAKLALENALKSNEPTIIAASWQINGSNYLNRFFRNHNKAYLDSATNAFQQSIQTYKKRKGFIQEPSVIVLSALNLANIYMEYYPPRYLDSIESNINLALKISQREGGDVMEINTYQVVSRLYQKTGRLDQAEKALLKGKKIADSLVPPNYHVSKNIYNLLAKLNERQGDYAKAVSYYKQYIRYYQKVFDTKRNKTIQRLEAKFQAEKKAEKVKLLQQQNVFQKKQVRLYLTIAIVAIIGVLALFVAYRFKLKYSRQLEKSKKEETARLQAEHKLVQSQKEQLQKEIMARSLQVEHKNELLQTLKEKLLEKAGKQPAEQLGKIINEELRLDQDFEHIHSELQELHPEFFNRLKEKANQKLTQLDLKYCSYLYLKLSSKQIAVLMNVEAKSVRMTKYRLKQKFGLPKEDDLNEFLHHNGM